MHVAADVQGVGHPLKGRAAPVAAIITEQVPLAVHDRPPTRSGALRAPASSSPVVVAGRRASRTARRGRCWCCPPPSATARMPQQDQLLHPGANKGGDDHRVLGRPHCSGRDGCCMLLLLVPARTR